MLNLFAVILSEAKDLRSSLGVNYPMLFRSPPQARGRKDICGDPSLRSG